MELKSRVEISAEVLCQEVNGEMVLLDLRSESYFGLDPTGTRIWQLLESGLTVQEMIEQMRAEYDVDEKTLRADVEKLLNELSAAGLVSVAPGIAS